MRKLNSEHHFLAISSPIVISSQESISSCGTKPSPVSTSSPSFTTTQHGNGTFPHQDAPISTTSDGEYSWMSNPVPASHMAQHTPHQDTGKDCFSSTWDFECDNPSLHDKVFGDEDFESYPIPDNFDDFQEYPQPLKPTVSAPSTCLSSAACPPKSTLNQVSTRSQSTFSSSKSSYAGNRGPSSTATHTSVQVLKPTPGGGDACKDNSVEFRGPYPHTKELFKVFTQVHVNELSILCQQS